MVPSGIKRTACRKGANVWVPTDYFFEQALLQFSEDSVSSPFIGVLAGAYVGLGINPVPALNRGTLLSQIVEASFPSYARKPLTWRLPYFGVNGLWDLEAECVHWQPTGPDANQVVTCAFVATAISGGQLLLATTLPSPGVDMSSIQDALTGIVRFGLDPLANYGDFTQVD